MSLVIEQNIESLRASASFNQGTELNAVCLISARLERHLDWSSLAQPIQIDFEFEPRDASVTEGHAEIRTNFRFRATDATAPRQQALLVECTFQATYDIDPEYTPDPRELIAFQSGNAIFNAWPYFREFVQTNVTRMNLPVPPVPFLRLIKKADGDGERSDALVPKEGVPKKRRNKK